MVGKLFIVGTPIGNLGDISPRAIEALQSADFIAAEDTRVTLKILNHFGIKKTLVSYLNTTNVNVVRLFAIELSMEKIVFLFLMQVCLLYRIQEKCWLHSVQNVE